MSYAASPAAPEAHPPASRTTEGVRHRGSWQALVHSLDRRQWTMLGGAYVLLVGAYVGIGKLLVGPLDDTVVGRMDRRVADWWVRQRTSTGNRLSEIGAFLGDTATKVIVTIVVALIMRWVWKRWREAVFVALALAFEALTFITVTFLVNRPRPDVPHLQDSPVDSSFPSGHTAAAATYVAFAVAVAWNTRRRWLPWLIGGLTMVVAFVVATSRMYQGVHYLTDVTFGALLGLISVAVVAVVVTRGRGHVRPAGTPDRSSAS